MDKIKEQIAIFLLHRDSIRSWEDLIECEKESYLSEVALLMKVSPDLAALLEKYEQTKDKDGNYHLSKVRIMKENQDLPELECSTHKKNYSPDTCEVCNRYVKYISAGEWLQRWNFVKVLEVKP
ncbi:MAG: hypothetical protein Q8P28_06465 [Deltaproteobacteria bacterium]|nr:hypothetical protein [Deltaproteobacteria bacterium]